MVMSTPSLKSLCYGTEGEKIQMIPYKHHKVKHVTPNSDQQKQELHLHPASFSDYKIPQELGNV